VASWSREAGDIVLVKTGRPHRCARVREGAHGQLPGARERGKSSAKKGARKSAVKNGAKGMSDMAGKAAR